MSLQLLPLSAEAELIIDNHRDLRRLAALGPMTLGTCAYPLPLCLLSHYAPLFDADSENNILAILLPLDLVLFEQ